MLQPSRALDHIDAGLAACCCGLGALGSRSEPAPRPARFSTTPDPISNTPLL